MFEVRLHNPQAVYAAGEMIAGVVSWDKMPTDDRQLSIRLIWYTSGKGTRDFSTVDSIEHDFESNSRSPAFEFVAPHRPLSFSGKLISLQWAVEAVWMPTRQSARAEFVLSTSGTMIELQEVPDADRMITGSESRFSFGKFRNR